MIVRTIFQFFGALLVGLLLAALLAFAPLVDRSVVLDVGNEGPLLAEGQTTTVRALFGYYLPEFAGGVSYRWTDSWARLSILNGRRLGDRPRLDLWLCGCHPEGQQPIVQLSIDHQAIAALPASGTYRHY